MFIKTDGTLWATGSNGYGQLGAGTTTDVNMPVQVASGVASVAAGSIHTMFVKVDGTMWAMGNNSFGQFCNGTTPLISADSPVQVASGVASVKTGANANHTLFIKTDGTFWEAGWNVHGQLGDGTTTDRRTPIQLPSGVVSFAAGGAYTMFVRSDGVLLGMGGNFYGQLGDGTTTDRSMPVPIFGTTIVAPSNAVISITVE